MKTNLKVINQRKKDQEERPEEEYRTPSSRPAYRAPSKERPEEEYRTPSSRPAYRAPSMQHDEERGERIPTGVCLTDGMDKYGYEFQCWEETDKVMLKVYECRGEDREEEEERFRTPSMS